MEPLRTLNSGLLVLMLPGGSVGCGVSITTGGTTLKFETAEYGPVLAPSDARERQ